MKQQRIYIRVTIEEKKLLHDRAQKTNKTISEFVRIVALKNNIVFTSDEMMEEIKDLKKELRVVTNHRNQNPLLKSTLDPIRASIHSILKKFS